MRLPSIALAGFFFLPAAPRATNAAAPIAAATKAVPAKAAPAKTAAKAAKPPAFDFAKQIGAVHRDHADRERICFDVPSHALPLGTRVTVVSLSAPQVVAEATVAGLCPSSSLTDVLLDKTPVPAQEIRWKSAPPDHFMWGIGVLGGARTTMKGDLANADLDGDGKPETFADCPSAEGAHLTVWTGEPRTGTRRWHGYLYLGMDLEASCTDAETRADQ